MGLEFSPKLMQKKKVLFSLPPSTFLWKCLYTLVFSRWKRKNYLPPIFHLFQSIMSANVDSDAYYD